MNSAEIREIIESRKTILETLSQMQRRLDAYEYSEENLEFLSNPHQIAMDEQLTSEEVSDIWDDIAGSLQLTPAWCLEARCKFTLSLGDRCVTFLALTRRLTGQHKAKLDACFLSRCSMADFEKYSPLSRLDHR
jgi:hypothetical protein